MQINNYKRTQPNFQGFKLTELASIGYQKAIKKLYKAKKGRIVNISSVVGVSGNAGRR